mgnify:FL=1
MSGEEHRIELERFVPYRLAVLAAEVSQCLAAIYMGRFNLSIAEWRVVATLGDQAPLSAREIGDRASLDKVQVSRAVARLLRAQLIVRQTAHHDRRYSQLQLSGKGRSLYREIVPLAKAREQQLLDSLSVDDRAALDRIVQSLLDRARDMLAESAP